MDIQQPFEILSLDCLGRIVAEFFADRIQNFPGALNIDLVGYFHIVVHTACVIGLTRAAERIDRVYDTLEMEANLNYVEHVVTQTLKRLDNDRPLSSETLTRELGKTLAEEFGGDGILKSAYLKKVPVFIPAFTDSEVGLDVGTWAMAREVDRARSRAGQGGDLAVLRAIHQSCPSFNPYLDLNSHRLMLDNSEMFVLAPDLPATGLDVGRLVTVDVATRGTDKVITKVLKYT